MDWDDYEIFDPGVDRPLHEVSRSEAKRAHDRLMAAIPERLRQLRRLAEANGVDLQAKDGLQRFNDWFADSVEADPANPQLLRGEWYSVVNDVGLLIGESLIERSGGKLRWELFTRGKKDSAYQRSVVMGFDVPNPKFNYDFDLAVGHYAHRIVRGMDHERDFFARLVEKATAKI